jgi:hypothetical protein
MLGRGSAAREGEGLGLMSVTKQKKSRLATKTASISLTALKTPLLPQFLLVFLSAKNKDYVNQ